MDFVRNPITISFHELETKLQKLGQTSEKIKQCYPKVKDARRQVHGEAAALNRFNDDLRVLQINKEELERCKKVYPYLENKAKEISFLIEHLQILRNILSHSFEDFQNELKKEEISIPIELHSMSQDYKKMINKYLVMGSTGFFVVSNGFAWVLILLLLGWSSFIVGAAINI